MKRFFILAGKIAVSLGLVVYALKAVDLRAIWNSMKTANPYFLCGAFLLIAVGFLVSALRWQILLRAQNVHIPLMDLTKSYLVGSFFNNFMPTTIGGDIVRTYDISKASHSVIQSFAVILVERMTGVFALIVYSVSGLVIGPSHFGHIHLVWWAGGAFCLGLILTVAITHIHRKQRGIFFLEATSLCSRIMHKWDRLIEAFLTYKDNKKSLMQGLGLAFLLQFNVILYFFIISRALEIESQFYHFMIIVPLVQLLVMFPVSINGIGVRENAFIFFLSKIGVHPAQSLVLSVLSFGMALVYAIIGGVIYAVRK